MNPSTMSPFRRNAPSLPERGVNETSNASCLDERQLQLALMGQEHRQLRDPSKEINKGALR